MKTTRMTILMMLVAAGAATVRAGQIPPEADKIPVESKAFEAVAYDRQAQTMTLWFDNGAVYAYREVPEPVFALFLHEPSKGGVYQRHIRGRFDGECLRLATPVRRATTLSTQTPSSAACGGVAKGGA